MYVVEVSILRGVCVLGTALYYVSGRRLPYPSTDLPVIAWPPQCTKHPDACISHWLILHAVARGLVCIPQHILMSMW